MVKYKDQAVLHTVVIAEPTFDGHYFLLTAKAEVQAFKSSPPVKIQKHIQPVAKWKPFSGTKFLTQKLDKLANYSQ